MSSTHTQLYIYSHSTQLYILPEGAVLRTIDVVGLYPNIPHQEGLASLRKFLDKRTKKKVTTENLLQFAEIVLKNNIFQFNEKTLKLLDVNIRLRNR